MRATTCRIEQRHGAGAGGVLWQASVPECSEKLLEAYAGKVQLAYIDPPFRTGQHFEMRMRVGEAGWRSGKPRIALPAYDDTWPEEAAYLEMMRGILHTAHGLLRKEGTLFLHVDPRMQAPLRIMLDEIFEERNFLNEIIWAYQSGGRAMRYFSRKHDVILFYRKSSRYFFDIKAAPLPRGEHRNNHMRREVDARGRACRTITSGGKKYVYYDDEPVYPGDVWQDVSHLQQKDPQRTGYDTQKPLSLLERIVHCASRPGDLVADLCFGSGTALVAAAESGRRFLGVDCGRMAHAVARKRLLPWAAEHRTELAASTVKINAELLTAIGFYEVALSACVPDAELMALGLPLTRLDAIDQWSVGFLRDDTFVATTHAARTAAKPVLPTKLEMPMLCGDPALCTVDVLGRRQVYVWEGRHA